MEGARGKELIGNRFRHLTWVDLHSFMSGHYAGLNREQKMMVEMHLCWIEDKNRTGSRGFSIRVDPHEATASPSEG